MDHEMSSNFNAIVRIICFWQPSLMFTPGQCRAARGLLGWSQLDLAKHARVGVVTVHQLEAAISQPRRATLDVIQRAFEAAGVEFTNHDKPGVRLSAAAARLLIAAHKRQPNAEKKRRSAKRREKRRN
jgi:transcriptional regulator with XRE-family HTH domain